MHCSSASLQAQLAPLPCRRFATLSVCNSHCHSSTFQLLSCPHLTLICSCAHQSSLFKRELKLLPNTRKGAHLGINVVCLPNETCKDILKTLSASGAQHKAVGMPRREGRSNMCCTARLKRGQYWQVKSSGTRQAHCTRPKQALLHDKPNVACEHSRRGAAVRRWQRILTACEGALGALLRRVGRGSSSL
eukprot:4190353-Pleurochrysis_carterae.AAC.2